MTNAEPQQQTATLTIDQALQQAVAHHHAGQLQDAERLYRAILQAYPHHPDANHNLGVLAVQVQQPAAGLPHLKAALEANPTQEQYWLSYIDALRQAGQTETARQVLEQGRQQGLQGEAVEALAGRLEAPSGSEPSPQEMNALVALFTEGRYTDAATLAQSMTLRFPLHGFGWKVLGAVFKQMGRNTDALMSMQKAVALSPGDADAYSNLGNTLRDLGRLDEAEAAYRRALEINPDFAEAYSNLGNSLHDLGRLDEAEVSCRRALEINPGLAVAHSNLGNTLHDLGRLDEAEVSCRRALEINPGLAAAHGNLGNILRDLGRLDEAEVSCRRALKINPGLAVVHSNLGNILQDLGRLDEAEASYRRALQINPDLVEAHSNLLFSLNHTSSNAPSCCLAEARQYGQKVGNKVTSHFADWSCAMQPERLRVGLVSGDFVNHPVGYFLESLLTRLDPGSIELIAYPTDHKADELTARIKPCFAGWRPLFGQSDEAAAHLIRSDGIHVLVDLSGHTRYNRLPMFAWKPAPVQVSWLGYAATTGVAAIDYLIADPWVLPETEETWFTEKIWRLPETRLCFTPPDVEVDVSPLPALANGYVTVGCFNNLAKMNADVVALWSHVLASVPNSRLFLKAKQLKHDSVRKNTLDRFAVYGISADRLVLEGPETREKYLAAYHRVDIALDPFPYPGGTTSVEGLWMGVPVLTLAGERFLSRQGVGILMNAGLPEWIATDADDYVARAVSHAADLQRLSGLRSRLRQQVLASPIFDAPRFARNFEAALRGMWQEWRDGQAKIERRDILR